MQSHPPVQVVVDASRLPCSSSSSSSFSIPTAFPPSNSFPQSLPPRSFHHLSQNVDSLHGSVSSSAIRPHFNIPNNPPLPPRMYQTMNSSQSSASLPPNPTNIANTTDTANTINTSAAAATAIPITMIQPPSSNGLPSDYHAPLSNFHTQDIDSAQQPEPPGYHTLDFPSTPPPLNTQTSSSHFADAFATHLRIQATSPPPPPPPPDHPPPPIEAAPQTRFASRFPRWRGWLEKRALERHYARLDAAAGAATVDSFGNPVPQPPRRQRSWGPGVHDQDALSDQDASSSQEESSPSPQSLPPLHVHHYGSRFIPHLHSQPLCSVLLELPPVPPKSNASILTSPTSNKPRQVVLIGTLDGLFVFQRRSFKKKPTNPDQPTPLDTNASWDDANQRWNDNIRCIHVWSGLAVYQMCILSSNDQATYPSSSFTSSARNEKSSSGILLALTAPSSSSFSSSSHSSLPSPLVQLSAQAGAVFESVASSAAATGLSSSSSSGHGHAFGASDPTEGVAAANFGCAAGGGPGRAVPPGGNGVVRMWNLEAIRKIILYALDHKTPRLPLDLMGERSASKEKKNKLTTMLKKAFIKDKQYKAGDPSSRRAYSDGMGGVIQPFDENGHDTLSKFHSAKSSDEGHHHTLGQTRSRRSSTHSVSPYSIRRSIDSLGRTLSRDEFDSTCLLAKDPDLAAAIALALSSVPINSLASQSSSHSSANAQGSFSNLFGDDIGVHSKGKDKESSCPSGRGVIFFAVHEAGPETKGTGTWYLALVTVKSVMVYEAVPPKRGSVRSWAWVKELYAPFAVKAIAFAPASVADTPIMNTASSNVAGGVDSTKLTVSSADAPLSASNSTKRGMSTSPNSVKRNTNGYSSILKPYHPVGGAAPASWNRADLCVFVSFGRRAVVIRLSDSNVREIELMPLAKVTVASNVPFNACTHLALQPSTTSSSDHQKGKERLRPHSMGLPPLSPTTAVNRGGGNGHIRSGSAEHRLKDASHLEKRAGKHNWVGYTSIQAQVRVRQRIHHQDSLLPESNVHLSSHPTTLPGLGSGRPASTLGPIPSSHSILNIPASSRNKELPKIPPPQNLSFDRRASRFDMDPESLEAYEAVQAESSSESDDDDDAEPERRLPNRGFSLYDRVLNQDNSWSPQNGNPSGRFGKFKAKKSPTVDAFQGTDLITAKMALVSRGSLTHVLPIPLPVDLARPLPLAVFQWSDTPNSVSAWARVLGLERARSSGPMSVDHWKQMSSLSSNVHSAPRAFALRPPLVSRSSANNATLKSSRIGVHVGVTAVAFLPSRIEMKRVSFKIEVNVGFEIHRNAELELVAPVPPSLYERPTTVSREPSCNKSQTRKRYSRTRNSIFGSTNDCWHPSSGLHQSSHSFSSSSSSSAAATATATATAATTTVTENDSSALSNSWQDQELEYLCGSLLPINPVDLDVTCTGSEAAVSHLVSPTSNSSLARHQVLRELAGDGGIIAFDWRGAEDYRIFCVGAQG